MPGFGQLAPEPIAARLPLLDSLDVEAWTLPGAEILQLAFEVADTTRGLLPRAMHPAIPPHATWLVSRYPDSPVGPFALAQLRLMARAGAQSRGYVLGAVATTPDAVRALRGGWGFPVVQGGVALRRHYDQVLAMVTRDGESVLEASLIRPEPVSGADVEYADGITLARNPEGGPPAILVQVDPHYAFRTAERGRPRISRFEARAWNAGGLYPLRPMAASVTICDTGLPCIRFVMDPTLPLIQGTRRIR